MLCDQVEWDDRKGKDRAREVGAFRQYLFKV